MNKKNLTAKAQRNYATVSSGAMTLQHSCMLYNIIFSNYFQSETSFKPRLMEVKPGSRYSKK